MLHLHSIRRIVFALAFAASGLVSSPVLAKGCPAGTLCCSTNSDCPSGQTCQSGQCSGVYHLCNVPGLGGNETLGGCTATCLAPNIPDSCYSGGSVNTGCVYSWIVAQCDSTAISDGYLQGIAGPLTSALETGCTGYFASCTFTNTSSTPGCTTPWGASLTTGQTMPAYSEATGNPTCPAVNTLSCNNGALVCSGGAVNPNCEYQSCAPATSCTTPWGAALSNGSTVNAYSEATGSPACPAANTLTCNSGSLACSGGTVNPNCEYQSCTAAQPTNCTTPWGVTLAPGQSVGAYSEASGNPNCPAANQLTCTKNGVLTCSGGTVNPNCEYAGCASECPLPWGGDLSSGQSVTAYQASSVVSPATCTSQTRTCANGTLSGSYQYQNCSVTQPICQEGVTPVNCSADVPPQVNLNNPNCYPIGTATLNPVGLAYCNNGVATCNTAQQNLANFISHCSTLYNNSNCVVSVTADRAPTGNGWDQSFNVQCGTTTPTVCTAPWGATLASGQSVNAYSESFGAPTCPAANTLTCSNGTLSCSAGSGITPNCQFPSCSSGCTTPWGAVMESGTSLYAYSVSTGTPNCPAANTLSCNNGSLACSGGKGQCNYQNCAAAASCTTPWGSTVQSGQSVTAYQAASVTAPATCTSQMRTCANGTLSGSYQYQNCAVTQACTFANINCSADIPPAANLNSDGCTAIPYASYDGGVTIAACVNGVPTCYTPAQNTQNLVKLCAGLQPGSNCVTNVVSDISGGYTGGPGTGLAWACGKK